LRVEKHRSEPHGERDRAAGGTATCSFVDAFSIRNGAGTPFLLTVSDEEQGLVQRVEGALAASGAVSDGVVVLRPDGGMSVEPQAPGGPTPVALE
jgi:hypothetical protein